MSDTRQLRRWGPVALLVVIAVVVVLVIVVGGDGDDLVDPVAPTVVDDETGTSALPDGVLPFDVAQADGIEVDWPETCDTERGTAAVPTFFAPDCFAPFDGDNGGATAPGVTGDTIKVVYYNQIAGDPIYEAIAGLVSDDTNAEVEETLRAMLSYYETYYETYGREVELVVYEGTGGVDDEVAARADAVTIAEEIQPFVVIGAPILAGKAFTEELAGQEVLSIALGAVGEPGFYERNDPYLLSVAKSPAQLRTHVAEYIGKRLAGEPAANAGDETMREQERVFGVVFIETGPDSIATQDFFEDELATYDVEPAAVVSYTDPVSLQADAAAVIAKLKEAGVTSVVFIGDPLAPKTLTEEATRQEYFPEWILSGSALVDTTAFARTYDQDQWANAFGVSNLSARTDPAVVGTQVLYRWWTCAEPPADDSTPLVLATPGLLYAALQGVGPDLTVENFKAALFSAAPTTRAITNPSLSYGDQGIWAETDYYGIDDTTEIWWDPTVEGPDETRQDGLGMYQYVDGGTRYLPGEWPETSSTAFDPEGAVALYEEPPPEEAFPDYPSPCEAGE